MAGITTVKAVAFAAASAALAAAATVTYDFNVTWVRANPDGAFERPVIGINNQWPIPQIEANVGDQVVVKVQNQLGNQTTTLHFHGLFMNGTSHMDGPAGVTQCPIPPGASFTYNFTINQPGTYWYHSHTHAQYPDGLRGPLIVHDPKAPYRAEVDEERVLTLSDWYHEEMQTLIPTFMTKNNPTGAEPVPQSALMNETQNLTVPVEPQRTYLFRVINIGAFAGQYLWIEGHKMRIVEVDGVYTKPAEADMIYLSAAQRVSFLLTTRPDRGANFPIVASMDTTLFDGFENIMDTFNWNVTGWLVYDAAKENPEPALISEEELAPFDDMTLEPVDGMELLPEPDRLVELNVIMDNLGDGANYAFFNNISYAEPRVPSLYSVLSAGELASNAAVYGEFTHPFVLNRGDIVQIVINNLDPGRHPFHLHGHNFQAIYRSEEEAGTFADEGGDEARQYPRIPMRRDTLVINPNGNMVLRYRADNPGVWLFHCHIEWHVVSGLIATFVEAPLDVQRQLSIPDDHLAVCREANVPTLGNAAANTADLLNLDGQNHPPPRLPDGFTPRGIVALVFSCIAGILGVAVIAWYGLAIPANAAPLGAAHVVGESHSANAQGFPGTSPTTNTPTDVEEPPRA
ncbi:hypothetical protein CDD81_5972 [Ophiocordyceps australis]|uniref:Uncharacterized protein n=1 Tax=Ophiocordyceps australis TaxID=1399860 RepID=A0A2C5YH93_9HYPO|nr:hypothetical protein CDD81_5972 [Ophiocordyceps australis]